MWITDDLPLVAFAALVAEEHLGQVAASVAHRRGLDWDL